jgi:hypothetical protein
VLGASGLVLVGFAVLRGATRGIGDYTIVIAGVTLVIGTALYALGQVLQRLLEDRGDD